MLLGDRRFREQLQEKKDQVQPQGSSLESPRRGRRGHRWSAGSDLYAPDSSNSRYASPSPSRDSDSDESEEGEESTGTTCAAGGDYWTDGGFGEEAMMSAVVALFLIEFAEPSCKTSAATPADVGLSDKRAGSGGAPGKESWPVTREKQNHVVEKGEARYGAEKSDRGANEAVISSWQYRGEAGTNPLTGFDLRSTGESSSSLSQSRTSRGARDNASYWYSPETSSPPGILSQAASASTRPSRAGQSGSPAATADVGEYGPQATERRSDHREAFSNKRDIFLTAGTGFCADSGSCRSTVAYGGDAARTGNLLVYSSSPSLTGKSGTEFLRAVDGGRSDEFSKRAAHSSLFDQGSEPFDWMGIPVPVISGVEELSSGANAEAAYTLAADLDFDQYVFRPTGVVPAIRRALGWGNGDAEADARADEAVREFKERCIVNMKDLLVRGVSNLELRLKV